jgi:hypothetical protein
MKSRKGFVFSIIAISFMLLLILLATTMANEYWESERVAVKPVPNTYASTSLGNIGNLAADILLPTASVNKGNASTIISITDYLPRQSDIYQLSELKTFAEGALANSLHAAISVNTTPVENGSLDVRIMDGYAFQSTMYNSSSMVFRGVANASSTNATRYNVTISVNDYRGSVSDFSNYSGNGSVNVTVVYTDENGTSQTDVSLNPVNLGLGNHLVINYLSGGKVDIFIGRVTQNGSYYDDALSMNLTNEAAVYSFTAEMPAQPPDSSSLIVFPVQMTYTQGGVQKIANASR